MPTNGLEFGLRILKVLQHFPSFHGLFFLPMQDIFFRTTLHVWFFHSIFPCTKDIFTSPPPNPQQLFLWCVPYHSCQSNLLIITSLFIFFNQTIPGSWEYHRCWSLCSDLLYEQKSLPLSADPGKFYLWRRCARRRKSLFPLIFVGRRRGEAKRESSSHRTSLKPGLPWNPGLF